MNTTKDKSVVIAIDGPAASGKGTLARHLAQHFDYAHLDTGALYRGVAFYTLESGGAPDNVADALKGVARLDIAALAEPHIAAAIRLPHISRAASKVATLPDIRAAILDLQRAFAAQPPDGKIGAVLDGRDIGTTVCPDADYKFYITARPEIRARRRLQELRHTNLAIALTYEQILDDIKARDAQDSSRKIAPLRRGADAHLLDTSDLSIEEAFRAALEIIQHKT